MSVPHGHWKTTTFVAGLRATGMVAPFVIDGPINRDAFQTYVEKVLVPELAPGDVVIMDNLSSHKGPRVRQMIEAAGARLLYLPPYSPDFNPIEQVWHCLRDRYLSGRLFSGTRAIVDACCAAWNNLIAETGRARSPTDLEWARPVDP